MKKWMSLLLLISLVFPLAACSGAGDSQTPLANNSREETDMQAPENFVLIQGGSFQMGSPVSEAWRSADETQHTVTVSDFYMSPYEVTQKEYEEIMGQNPSHFTGDDLPVETISWLDAVAYGNVQALPRYMTACSQGLRTCRASIPTFPKMALYGKTPRACALVQKARGG